GCIACSRTRVRPIARSGTCCSTRCSTGTCRERGKRRRSAGPGRSFQRRAAREDRCGFIRAGHRKDRRSRYSKDFESGSREYCLGRRAGHHRKNSSRGTEANSMKAELPKIYNPQEVEARWYQWWESKGYFRADAKSTRPKFVIMMPPPNVTGSLHMGHM